MGGATIVEGVSALGVTTGQGRVTGVVTDQGTIECEYVVNCGGMWARQLRAGRDRRSPPGRRALLPDHRAHGGGPSRPAGHRGPRLLRDTFAPKGTAFWWGCSNRRRQRGSTASLPTPRLSSCPRTMTAWPRSWRWPWPGCPRWPIPASSNSSADRSPSPPTSIPCWAPPPSWTTTSWPPASTPSASCSVEEWEPSSPIG